MVKFLKINKSIPTTNIFDFYNNLFIYHCISFFVRQITNWLLPRIQLLENAEEGLKCLLVVYRVRSNNYLKRKAVDRVVHSFVLVLAPVQNSEFNRPAVAFYYFFVALQVEVDEGVDLAQIGEKHIRSIARQ